MEKEEFLSYITAGKIAAKVKEETIGFIKKGMPLIEIAEFIESKILNFGGKPAFPVNLSINEVAAHYTPSLKDEKKAAGLLKVDFGVEVEGFIADLAFSMDLTENKEHFEMIAFNESILKEVLEGLQYGEEVCSIGNKISYLLKERNFNIIRNLSGHTLKRYKIHASPTILNIKNNDKTQLKEMAIAIEPFLTKGIGEVIESSPSEIFILFDERKKPRDNDARKILEFIKEEYGTKPFCKRWLEKKGFNTFYLSFLKKERILYNFPILIEKSKMPVSQAEDTIVFFGGKKFIITK